MPTPKKITPGIFNAIKRLQADGATVKECVDYFDISDSTIRRVFYAETFEEYKNETAVRSASMKAIRAKEQQNVQPAQQEVIHKHEQSVTVIANHYMMEELKEHTRLLTLISNKLAFIVDELTGTGNREAGS